MLTLRNVVAHYGGVRALKGISLTVDKGCITSLIGANGAGKSTTLKAISGLVPITSGEVFFEGQRIDGLEPEKIVEMGIGHVPEGKQLFLEMSVLDNLLTGAYLRRDTEKLDRDLEWIYGYFPVLRRARHRKASQLSGGEQQMVAIGRGLMSKPKLLLLDEPSLGLSPILTEEVGAIIKRIAEEGMSILLIEQNANLALSLAKRNYVLETGKIVLEGSSQDFKDNKYVRAAYLGLGPDGPPEFQPRAETPPARIDKEPRAEPPTTPPPPEWAGPPAPPEPSGLEPAAVDHGTIPEPARPWTPESRAVPPPTFQWIPESQPPAPGSSRRYPGETGITVDRIAPPREELDWRGEAWDADRIPGPKKPPVRVIKRILTP